MDDYVSRDKQLKDGQCHGHLICDELKLQWDILSHSRTKKIQGFVGNNNGFVSLRDKLANLLADSATPNASPAPEHVPAQYVNQWRFRTIHGITHNVEFFFNNSSPTGDEMLEQVMHVTTM